MFHEVSFSVLHRLYVGRAQLNTLSLEVFCNYYLDCVAEMPIKVSTLTILPIVILHLNSPGAHGNGSFSRLDLRLTLLLCCPLFVLNMTSASSPILCTFNPIIFFQVFLLLKRI